MTSENAAREEVGRNLLRPFMPGGRESDKREFGSGAMRKMDKSVLHLLSALDRAIARGLARPTTKTKKGAPSEDGAL